MAISFPGLNVPDLSPLSQKGTEQKNPTALPEHVQARIESRLSINAINNPTELILKSAMEQISAMFAPEIGDNAIKHAVESGQNMSPEATADRIISFATRLIGRAEAAQADMSPEEQRSREQLFNNIQVGIEKGFEQARDILEGLQALNGDVKVTVDDTYGQVQNRLSDLATLLGLQPAKEDQA